MPYTHWCIKGKNKSYEYLPNLLHPYFYSFCGLILGGVSVTSLPRNSFLRRVSEGGDNISADVQKLTKVQAMYSHIASTESQLNFNEVQTLSVPLH